MLCQAWSQGDWCGRNENKVRLMNEGKPTIIEEGIAELCAKPTIKGLMSATTVAAEAVDQTEVSFIVVVLLRARAFLNLNYILYSGWTYLVRL